MFNLGTGKPLLTTFTQLTAYTMLPACAVPARLTRAMVAASCSAW
jgi:hypothetical protein